MTVAELLAASRAAHATYRKVHDDAARDKAKKPDGWQAHLWDALHFRRLAHAADPQHTDPAWSETAHDALMDFYERQLGLST